MKTVDKHQSSKGPIYAVVDLETTGTSLTSGSRVIQIGCVLVQNQKVINQFESKVNPGMAIPQAVQQLTGIHNRDLKQAPYFDEIAPTIYALLTGTTFVAHNVNFDFAFINMELERAGYPTLEIPAIDTVTLSQILMPTAESFRLRDLTKYLAIEHDNPHSAISDADATATLLIDLMKRLDQLPTPTLKHLQNMNLKLPLDTALMFDRALVQRQKQNYRLSDDLYMSGNLVLHKVRPVQVENALKRRPYPHTKRQKLAFFGDQFQYRPIQAKLMNSIYNQFSHSDTPRQLVVEAGTGTGKTLGYLVPLSYLAYPHDQIIVSTATNVLQQQIQAVMIPQLNALLPFKMTAVIVKGNQHYIHLGRFARSLSMTDDAPNVQLLKARILVWLLTTTTGDLDELNLNAMNSPFFAQIRHGGLRTLTPDEPYYRDDFLVRRQRALQFANIIITNHAYLVAHADELTNDDQQAYLVVDEAQHLSQSVMQQSRTTISFQRVATDINQLHNLVSHRDEHNLTDVFKNLPLGAYNVELLYDDLDQVSQAVTNLEEALMDLLPSSQSSTAHIDQPIDNQAFQKVINFDLPQMIELEQALASVQLHFTSLQRLFNGRRDSWLMIDRYLMSQFNSYYQSLIEFDQQLHEISKTVQDQPAAAVFWLSVNQGNETSTLKLSGGLLEQNHFLSHHVYPYFSAMIFTGATLFSSHKSSYLYQHLDLVADQVRIKRFGSPFDFQQQTHLYIAKDALEPEQTSQYVDYLAQTIAEITIANPCQTMILFNSLVTIEQVYSRLRNTGLFDQRDILAQGITGNRDKILKQFATGTDSVLLGAASFWEGIDLPEDQLQLLIITRLPFDSPDQVMVKAQHEHLKAQGQSPFYQADLPKMIMRMRQGIGRILRTEDDYGVTIVLDPRLISRRYGKSVLNMLPDNLPVEQVATNQLANLVKKFLKNHR